MLISKNKESCPSIEELQKLNKSCILLLERLFVQAEQNASYIIYILDMDPCSIGTAMNWECHRTAHTHHKDLLRFQYRYEIDQQLIKLRTGILADIETFCLHYLKYLIDKFESFMRVCCDPFEMHKSTRKRSLRTISIALTREASSIGLTLIPGKKLCPTCRGKILRVLQEPDECHSHLQSDEDKVDNDIVGLDKSFSTEEERGKLSDCLTTIGLSPLKIHSQLSCSKIQQGKRKIDAAITTLKEKVSKSLDVPLHRLEPREETVMHDTIKKAEEFDHLMLSLKEKLLP